MAVRTTSQEAKFERDAFVAKVAAKKLMSEFPIIEGMHFGPKCIDEESKMSSNVPAHCHVYIKGENEDDDFENYICVNSKWNPLMWDVDADVPGLVAIHEVAHLEAGVTANKAGKLDKHGAKWRKTANSIAEKYGYDMTKVKFATHDTTKGAKSMKKFLLEKVVEEPEAEAPATEEPADQEPVIAEPQSEVPATEEPVIEEPQSEVPATEEPVIAEPQSEVPATEEPATEEPVIAEPQSEETFTCKTCNGTFTQSEMRKGSKSMCKGCDSKRVAAYYKRKKAERENAKAQAS